MNREIKPFKKPSSLSLFHNCHHLCDTITDTASLTFEFVSEKPRGHARVRWEEDWTHHACEDAHVDPAGRFLSQLLQRHRETFSPCSFSSCSDRACARQRCNAARESSTDGLARQHKCVSTAPQLITSESSRCFPSVLEHVQLGLFWECGLTVCINLFPVHPWAVSASFETWHKRSRREKWEGRKISSPSYLLLQYLNGSHPPHNTLKKVFFRKDAQCYRFSQGRDLWDQNIQRLESTKSTSLAEITVQTHNLQPPVVGCQPHNSFCTMNCWMLL